MVYLLLAAVGVVDLTPAAQWIMDSFFQLDKAILAWYHGLAMSTGGLLTPIADLISWTGWKGLALIVVTVVLLIIPRTRKIGLYCGVAMAIGYLAVNKGIKPAVARPRPYDFDGEIRTWWNYVSSLSFSLPEHDLSFPSGHMNAATAFAAGLVFSRGKTWYKWAPWMLLYVVLMGMSRNYLMVHYPSDILFGFCTGLIAACLSAVICGAIYKRWGNTRLLGGSGKGAHEK